MVRAAVLPAVDSPLEIADIDLPEPGPGQVDINGGRFNPLAPFGGYKQSGVGRELGAHGLAEYLQTKSLQF